jgi:putative thioredoxin
MVSDHIVSVSEADFEYEVIAYSKNKPVVVDFWADWCKPCKTLTPFLEKLTLEAAGVFRLAKVDVDESPNLALQYGVRSIPNVKAFRAGQVIAEFVGIQPESRIRDFLSALAPDEHELIFEKATGLLSLGQYASAESAFRQFLAQSPGHPGGLLGLLRSIIFQSRVEEANQLLPVFPASKEYPRAQALQPLLNALLKITNSPEFSDDPREAAYLNSLRLVKRGNYEAAMDGLLDVIRQDKRFRQGEPRKIMLGIFELLGDDHPLTQSYRQELAQVLF